PDPAADAGGGHHLPLSRPLHVRSGKLPDQGRDRRVEEARRGAAGARAATEAIYRQRRRVVVAGSPCQGRGAGGGPLCRELAACRRERHVELGLRGEILMARLSYREALNQAMAEEMERDGDIFLMGEEVDRKSTRLNSSHQI